jgi:hypothetical protein
MARLVESFPPVVWLAILAALFGPVVNWSTTYVPSPWGLLIAAVLTGILAAVKVWGSQEQVSLTARGLLITPDDALPQRSKLARFLLG